MASISGNVTPTGDAADWVVVAYEVGSGSPAGLSAVVNQAYEVSGLTAGKAYLLTCLPQLDAVWTAQTLIEDGSYCVPANPVTTPYLFKASGTTADACRLLCQFDGADNGTTFTDESPSPVTPSMATVVTKTDQKVFGTASGYFSGSGAIKYDSSTKFGLGTGDWTIEMRIRPTASGAFQCILYLGTPGGQYLYLGVNDNGNYEPFLWNEARVIIGTKSFTQNTWQHLALTKESGLVRMFLDGAQIGSYKNNYNLSTTNMLSVGYNGSNSIQYFYGNIDALRIVAGKALYTSDFLVPAYAPRLFGLTGSSEPAWPTTPGATVVDGSVTWTNMGRVVQPLTHGPLIAA